MSERRNKIAESVLSKLRAKLAEETEELDEGLETQTIKHPVGQRPKGIGWTLKQAGEQTGKDHSVWQRKVKKTVANEEVEDLDEVSKKTLGSYIKKATNQVFSKGVAGGMGLASSNKEDEASGHRQVNKAAKRMLGINKAASKLSGHGYTKVSANEETEELDELSYDTLVSYRTKATKAIRDSDTDDKTVDKREIGHNLAGKKMLAKLRKEEAEDLDELYKTTLKSYIKKAGRQAANADDSAEHLRGLGDKWKEKMPKNNAYAAADKHAAKSEKRLKGIRKAVGKLDRGEYEPGNSKLAKEENECCATDTSLSDIKPSAKGEVYSKTKEKSTAATKPTGTTTGVTAGKTGEAYNSTGLTKRIPAVESAVAEVMAKSLERRRIYNESANIAIISPEQRQDWMNVERGMMDVVTYFNKYRAGEE